MKDAFPGWRHLHLHSRANLVFPYLNNRTTSLPPQGSSTMKDAFRGWRLPAQRGSLGLEMHKDRFYVLIPSDAPLPAVGKQVRRAPWPTA